MKPVLGAVNSSFIPILHTSFFKFPMTDKSSPSVFAPSVVLVDADFLDRVAFDLIVNFERMIGRRIPKGDLCHWLDCVALDGGLRPGAGEIQAHFLYSPKKKELQNFTPSKFREDLNGLRFDDRIGSFSLFAFPVEEIISGEEFFLQSFAMLCEEKQVKNLIVVADMDAYGDKVTKICRDAKDTDITLLTMQPVTGRGFSQEILGYSLMSALGIKSEELA